MADHRSCQRRTQGGGIELWLTVKEDEQQDKHCCINHGEAIEHQRPIGADFGVAEAVLIKGVGIKEWENGQG